MLIASASTSDVMWAEPLWYYIYNVCESLYNICHIDDKWANHIILSHILPATLALTQSCTNHIGIQGDHKIYSQIFSSVFSVRLYFHLQKTTSISSWSYHYGQRKETPSLSPCNIFDVFAVKARINLSQYWSASPHHINIKIFWSWQCVSGVYLCINIIVVIMSGRLDKWGQFDPWQYNNIINVKMTIFY